MKFCVITLIVGGPYYKVLDTSITDTTDVPQEQMEEDNKKAKKGSQDKNCPTFHSKGCQKLIFVADFVTEKVAVRQWRSLLQHVKRNLSSH